MCLDNECFDFFPFVSFSIFDTMLRLCLRFAASFSGSRILSHVGVPATLILYNALLGSEYGDINTAGDTRRIYAGFLFLFFLSFFLSFLSITVAPKLPSTYEVLMGGTHDFQICI
ncbi:hypothetical protein F5B19DRAFT_140959 [Rostrohypoxylon terebratum]|nr:hypothetical protein F5B19DRAFT_140959 [Rostrohypoxylon terebratum]